MAETAQRLRGMTWDHVRGYGPLLAVSEKFRQLHPDCEIAWDKRSLKDFGDYPVASLANQYDLLLIDHPHVGLCAAQGVLAPLDTLIPEAYLAKQSAHSVGPSYASYEWGGSQWALPVDAAAQVASYRPDLLGMDRVPRTWQEVRELAASLPADQRIGWPLCPTDAMCSFLSLCAGISGKQGFFDEANGLLPEVAEEAVRHLLDFLPLLHHRSLAMNPIQMYDYMAMHQELVYVPMAFGYVNYAIAGFAPHRLRYANIPGFADAGDPAGSLLGGVGMAVSRSSPQIELAVAFAMLAADPLIQRTLYFEGGGQPGHVGAWLDERTNGESADFFADTLQTLHRSYMRPRHAVFPVFQEKAGALLHEELCRSVAGKNVHPSDSVRELNALYRTLLQGLG